MSDQLSLPDAPGGPVGPAAEMPSAPVEAGWGRLREIGLWPFLRMLPGLVRSALKDGTEIRGGDAIRRYPTAEYRPDHLADAGHDSYPTSGLDACEDAGSADAGRADVREDVDAAGADSSAAQVDADEAAVDLVELVDDLGVADAVEIADVAEAEGEADGL
jgi:hypothetical protein